KEREDVPIRVQLSRESRSSTDALRGLYLNSPDGAMVPLGELVKVQEGTIDKNVYRKGTLGKKIDGLKIPEGYGIEQFTAIQPPNAKKIAVKWDGEWHITYEVFRDLGLAFAA